MKAVSINIWCENLVVSGEIANIVVPKIVRCVASNEYISNRDKAGFLFGVSALRSLTVFGEITRELRLSLLYIQQVFRTMPKTENLTANAQGAPKSRITHDTSVATIQLPVSSPYSIPCFADFMAEAQRRFDVERNAKNRAYSFILYYGLLEDFAEFCKTPIDAPHMDCLDYLTADA